MRAILTRDFIWQVDTCTMGCVIPYVAVQMVGIGCDGFDVKFGIFCVGGLSARGVALGRVGLGFLK